MIKKELDTSASVSMTGAVSFFLLRNFSRTSSDTRVQSLSRLTDDFQTWCVSNALDQFFLYLSLMEITHANFSKVTRMVYPKSVSRKYQKLTFIKICSMMMLSTSQTTTSWMFAMFAHTTMAMTDMATKLSCVAQSCRHCSRELYCCGQGGK